MVIIIIQLTVPFEPQITESHEYKMAKYEYLYGHICIHRYEAQLYAVEVDARGSLQSLWALANRLGIGLRIRDYYVHSMFEVTDTTSMWIWWRKGEHDSKQPKL